MSKRPAPKPHKHSGKSSTKGDALFRQLVLKHYDDPASAFHTHKGQDGLLGRKAFKKLIESLGMKIADADRKQLRKRVSRSKAIDLESFVAFIVREESSVEASSKTEAHATGDNSEDHLVALPIEVTEQIFNWTHLTNNFCS